MGTMIRPEISEKNPYWIEKHRYYELKHFCLQYPIWKKIYISFDGYNKTLIDPFLAAMNKEISNPTERCAEAREFYYDRIRLIENIVYKTDENLADYILTGVTEGISYDILKARLNIPCSKDVYYNLYRRFFWLLDKARG